MNSNSNYNENKNKIKYNSCKFYIPAIKICINNAKSKKNHENCQKLISSYIDCVHLSKK